MPTASLASHSASMLTQPSHVSACLWWLAGVHGDRGCQHQGRGPPCSGTGRRLHRWQWSPPGTALSACAQAVLLREACIYGRTPFLEDPKQALGTCSIDTGQGRHITAIHDMHSIMGTHGESAGKLNHRCMRHQRHSEPQNTSPATQVKQCIQTEQGLPSRLHWADHGSCCGCADTRSHLQEAGDNDGAVVAEEIAEGGHHVARHLA